MDKKTISLPMGNEMTVEYTDEFIGVIKKFFNLKDSESLTDNHIRRFVYENLKSAVDKGYGIVEEESKSS